MIAQLVYILCGLTSVLCAVLLFRQYRLSRSPLLFWSTWCFVCFAVTNSLLFVDIVMFPQFNMNALRSGSMFLGMMMLIHGLIQERK